MRKRPDLLIFTLVIITLLMLALASCIPPFPLAIANLRPLTPRIEYYEWYLETAQCASVDTTSYPFKEITWKVADALYNSDTEDPYAGVFLHDGDIIILRDYAVTSEVTVKHELMHYFDFEHSDQLLWDCSLLNIY